MTVPCEKAHHTFVREDGRVINYCKEKECKTGFKVPTGRSCYEDDSNDGGGFQF